MRKALNIPLEEFLRPFFGPGERICLRIFDDRKTGTFKGAKLETSLSGLPGLMDTLKKHNEKNRGIYFVVNFGGHEDSEITRINAQFMECDELPLDEQLTLRFLCPDPYGYALDDETFTLSQAGEHEVEREIGNTDSEPVYSLQGTISSGAIVLTTNGENLRVIGPLAAGEVLVIDTGMVTAKVTDSAGNTLRNGLPCLEELNFPILRRGMNEVEIAVEGSAVFTELHIQAKSRWR